MWKKTAKWRMLLIVLAIAIAGGVGYTAAELLGSNRPVEAAQEVHVPAPALEEGQSAETMPIGSCGVDCPHSTGQR